MLSALPRRDHKFVEVSSNWRDYPFLNCTTNNATGRSHCSTPDTGSMSSDLTDQKLDYWLAPYLVVGVQVALLQVALAPLRLFLARLEAKLGFKFTGSCVGVLVGEGTQT